MQKGSQDNAMTQAFKEAGQGKAQENGQQSGAPQGGYQPGGQRARGGAAFSSLAAQLRGPMPMNNAGEFATAAVKYFKDVVSNDQSLADVGIHFLDGDQVNIPLSLILVTWQHEADVICQTLIVEGSGDPLGTSQVQMYGQNVTIQNVAADVYDSLLWEQLEGYLGQRFPNCRITEAGVSTIPAHVNAEDQAALYGILLDAVNATWGVLNQDIINAPAVTASSIPTDGTTSIRVEFDGGQHMDACGNFMRSDISIALEVAMQQHDRTWVKDTLKLADISMFCDLVYTKPQPIANAPQQGYGMPAPVGTQCYYPRLVLTNLSHGAQVGSLELQLLGLGQVYLMAENSNFSRAFRPRYQHPAGVDFRDIGAVGIECNLTGAAQPEPAIVDTKADSFDDMAFANLMGMAVHKDLLISWDIDEAGPLRWLQGVFLAAANGDREAEAAIFEAANTLTDGKFSTMYDGAPIFITEETDRIHLGNYTDGNGEVRDIRELDYLAMLNLFGKTDHQSVINYGDTFVANSAPAEIRLERRLQIMQGALSGLQITGYATRVTFNPNFLFALSQSLHQAGVNVRPDNFLTGNGMGVRGVGNWSNYTADSNRRTGLYNAASPYQGYGQGGNWQGGYQGGYHGAWNRR